MFWSRQASIDLLDIQSSSVQDVHCIDENTK